MLVTASDPIPNLKATIGLFTVYGTCAALLANKLTEQSFLYSKCNIEMYLPIYFINFRTTQDCLGHDHLCHLWLFLQRGCYQGRALDKYEDQ